MQLGDDDGHEGVWVAVVQSLEPDFCIWELIVFDDGLALAEDVLEMLEFFFGVCLETGRFPWIAGVDYCMGQEADMLDV